ncbi:MAG: uroporphyrinogen-III synthase [Bacteroidetes bacterium]|jgi:uroporphyrinogen-III synthase|nr:uroporphyrinogen-III synthase [Bacteroidota bacterium]
MAQKKNKASKKNVATGKKSTKKTATAPKAKGVAKSARQVSGGKAVSKPSKKTKAPAKKVKAPVKVTKPVKKISKSSGTKTAIAKPLAKAAVGKAVKSVEKPVVVGITQASTEEKKAPATKAAKPARPAGKIPVNPGPQYVEADKNSPRVKVRTILISQPKPESEKSPFLEIARKYNVKMNFRQFIQIDPVPAREFRQQRINLMEHNAVILTSRVAIDHYFRMCNEMRYTVPETTKYFCLTESIAYYLQKYVQYRKRKIFFGQQSINDLVDVIKKHKEEKFLLPVSDVHRERIVDFLDEMKLNYSKATFYRTVCADLTDFNGKLDYDVVVFFTPMGIKSLQKNFPNLKQGDLRIGAFGYATCQALKDAGFRLDIAAPTRETPSMATAIENYIKEVNKR